MKYSNYKHGGYQDHLYMIWTDIKMRCAWPEHRMYDSAGAKGLKVADEWLNDYEAFREYALNHGYEDGFHIHRRDFDKDFVPDNIFFSDMAPGTKYLEYNGELKTQAEWARTRGLKKQTLSKRLKSGWSVGEALGFEPRH